MAASRQVIISRMGRHIARSEQVLACHVFAGRCVTNNGGGLHGTMQLYDAMRESEGNGHIGVAVTVSRVLFAQQTRGQWEEFSVRHVEMAHVEFEDALTHGVLGLQLKSGVRVTVRGAGPAKGNMRELHDVTTSCIDLTEVYGSGAEELLARIPPTELDRAVVQLVRERTLPPQRQPDPVYVPVRRPAAAIEHEPPALPRQVSPEALAGPGGTGGDIAQQMLKLGEMYRDGLLSEEEFAAMKRRLLG